MIYLYNVTDAAYQDLAAYLESIESDTGDTFVVMFLMPIEELFVAVKKKTALRGRFAKGQNGEPLHDQLSLTDDERDLFDSAIKTGAATVFRKLSAWAKNIENAYQHDVTFGEGSTKYIIFCIEMDTNWNVNMLQGVDNAIWEALICSVVKHWYYLNRYTVDFDAEETSYQVELAKIRSQLFHTRTAIRRPADMFEPLGAETLTTKIVLTNPASSGGESGVIFYEFDTGALTANVTKTVAHNKNMASYTITARSSDDTNNAVVGILKKNDADPNNAIDIEVSIDIAEPGLKIQIVGQ